MADIPYNEPDEIVAGDTLEFLKNLSDLDYDPDDYTLTYYLRGAASIDIVATAYNGEFLISVAKTTTLNWTAGVYSWESYVSDATERFKISEGRIEIKQNPIDVTAATDIRTHAEKVLDAIEAVIENRATVDQQAYMIGNRRLDRMRIEDLLHFRNYYASKVAEEEATRDSNNKKATGRKILSRFV